MKARAWWVVRMTLQLHEEMRPPGESMLPLLKLAAAGAAALLGWCDAKWAPFLLSAGSRAERLQQLRNQCQLWNFALPMRSSTLIRWL